MEQQAFILLQQKALEKHNANVKHLKAKVATNVEIKENHCHCCGFNLFSAPPRCYKCARITCGRCLNHWAADGDQIMRKRCLECSMQDNVEQLSVKRCCIERHRQTVLKDILFHSWEIQD